jgi:hypothetical protein
MTSLEMFIKKLAVFCYNQVIPHLNDLFFFIFDIKQIIIILIKAFDETIGLSN